MRKGNLFTLFYVNAQNGEEKNSTFNKSLRDYFVLLKIKYFLTVFLKIDLQTRINTPPPFPDIIGLKE